MSTPKNTRSLTLVSSNRYVLRGRNVSVTYGDAGADGKSYLNFANAEVALTFKGDEIRVIQNTDVGKIVSVSIRRTIDAGSTSFTILLPRAMIANGQVSTPIKTVGITTFHKFSVIQTFIVGQDDIYTSVTLYGTASVEIHP